MPPHQYPRVPHTQAVRYRSISCLIGTHHECTQSAQAAAPVEIPVVYEACSCSCHPMAAAIVNRTDVPR
ncbi:hypothetical protein GCM10010446_50510 [Streptomyces enissocaesilis]|uniref:Uncharacterized protein n=1 Tax=Streptomyces enissocaesilis TaxID=332589 RepID=A0ABP6K0R3_9ACTN